ncbi:hypothetical protein RU820_06115 [Acidithiobacillus ferrooxidans]|uniref:Uncharacterized protein n=1 Tax=Acidithiobacillus ferrooxidans (strain ATCC 23270 / DSM 14882 / CIP 104768 / NCIMB 8455) TaxID=243159 RepID=B7J8W6_ACIF2|nr:MULTISPECIES: hypothetical protein [Acidithiobacillus]ACK80110.1 hypothetical protein AFE_1284 [Acidithiobacillus ferrooxidans ATCC 23270]MBN6744328.1 hypothetical protein [Acidithiobacillus sp. MC2.2]MBN6747287.1 hypothetical protein [Acidithiobacillus sp. PG05]
MMLLYICMSCDFKKLWVYYEAPGYQHEYWGNIHGDLQSKMHFCQSNTSQHITGRLESMFPGGWRQIVPAVRIETKASDGEVLRAISRDLGKETPKYAVNAESVVRKTLRSFDQNAAYGIFPDAELSLRTLEKQFIARLFPVADIPWAF